MITLEQIRINLIDAIKHSGKSQKEIAAAIGVTQQTVSEYIHCKSMPALDTFARICECIDCDPAEILCIKNPSA